MGKSAYDRLVDALVAEGYLSDPALQQAFRRVRREDFLPPGMEMESAVNAPLPIGGGQTISQPMTVAFMLQLLAVRSGDRVLDVGSGSGWSTALLAHLVGPAGQVYAVERIPDLQRFGQGNVAKYGYANVTMVCGDGTLGLAEHAPFDRIQVAAAAAEVPSALRSQLKVGGRMVIPTQDEDLRLIVRRAKDEYNTTIYPGFLFVPLIEGK
ncbi:MAG: protein-L-isoaspartate(D-aspartate) O-methyltransferase [Parcubacteria group bacterium Gr01-1014_31]|nr:MAG: protein-L-isoaspartate(D-aspartate) O-methyltransferase [Parcubacteria group bacterium Gr01-1014_31]